MKRVHSQNDERGAALCGRPQAARKIIGRGRANGTFDRHDESRGFADLLLSGSSGYCRKDGTRQHDNDSGEERRAVLHHGARSAGVKGTRSTVSIC
ncbi:MAG: hypothetical protein ACREXY_13540 [Gammaproteobacteria bacterium]